MSLCTKCGGEMGKGFEESHRQYCDKWARERYQGSKDTEIVRAIQVDDKVVHVHIHLTEDEIRRLLLPHVVEAFASELARQTTRSRLVLSGGTTAVAQHLRGEA